MLRHLISTLYLGIIILPALLLGQNKMVIGYYQSWQWQASPEALNPNNIPYDQLSAINYSFFYPLESGELVGMDPVADCYLLEGGLPEISTVAVVSESIIKLAQSRGTKVLLSIGGWDHSGEFSQVAANPEKRIMFAHSCAEKIRQYGFDGIDIDWEFPGYVRHGGTPNDRENFTFLLETVRDSLNVLGEASDTHYLLTASLPAAAGHLPDIEVKKISKILDYLNIMTWDLFGSWGKLSNHNSALYGPSQGDSTRSLDGAFKLYHEQYDVPAEKINLGVAFYGHSYSQCVAIYTEHGGANTTLFPEGDGISYANIMDNISLFEHHWDLNAQAPYLVSESEKTLISFDNEKSTALKAAYVINNNSGGLIIWPLMGDYMRDGTTPLLDVIGRILK